MIVNYLKIGLRNVLKERVNTWINVFGMTLSIASVILAILYVQDEFSFDQFHSNNPNLYRVTTSLVTTRDGKRELTGGTGQVQGPVFKANIPEIKGITRVMGGKIYSDVRAGNSAFRMRPLYVDDRFFNVFTFDLIRGDKGRVLRDINSVVLTEKTALRFFNSVDVVGKLLQLDADPSADRLGKPLVVSGVVQDPPANSSIQFELLLPLRFMQLAFDDTNWLSSYLGTFVVLHPDANRHTVIRKFNSIYKRFAAGQLAKNQLVSFDPKIEYGLQSMTDIHLNPLEISGEDGIDRGSKPIYSYLTLAVATLILLMACINFINLSLAGSIRRTKEVGVRKATGGARYQLMSQFLTESSIVCLAGFTGALALVYLILPGFNMLSDKQITFSMVFGSRILLILAIVFLINMAGAGLYPAWVISKMSPIKALYHRNHSAGKAYFSKGFIVFQFSLTVFLLVATLVFQAQMKFIETKYLGYNADQIVFTRIPGNRDLERLGGLLKSKLAAETSVRNISFGEEYGKNAVKIGAQEFSSRLRKIDENHLAVLGITLKAGRNFSAAFPSDKLNGVIVNEAFVKAAGLQRPLGQTLQIGSEGSGTAIIGVVKDFHFGSLKERIEPVVLFMGETTGAGIWIKIDPLRQKEALAVIQNAFKTVMPEAVYEYHFMDELNAREYDREQRWQHMIRIASGISMLICCMGLFGLISLLARQRVKEIGIRKVLGASVQSVVVLLTFDFVKLIFVAVAVACPTGYVVMNKWLLTFAYHIEIQWWVFAWTVFGAVLMVTVTVGFQSIKAALADPVKSLKTE
ncbi:hypothetical protein DYBT9275_03169 [Dyadobacter sp. CECT 9275]|uniref:FtsX-like permease family protein n=1 Tax=Dyadobacter helix TaxID=2822344 RepID=A0A916JH43_9BACT|nr:ABC transporter permease [Dyadobacter sp. CECT 9275]CAG5003514.1 hypothetical protein DYBT9275_03169 [Dyadobacter sp. CECT 9275]